MAMPFRGTHGRASCAPSAPTYDIAVGRGMIRSAHGLLPNPAPAVIELLRDVLVRGNSATQDEVIRRRIPRPLSPSSHPARKKPTKNKQ